MLRNTSARFTATALALFACGGQTDLEAENVELRGKVAVLESENEQLRDKLEELTKSVPKMEALTAERRGLEEKLQWLENTLARDGVPARPWRVSYADGSGNRYRLWQEGDMEIAKFEYEPVTPERSASGVYSGGSPARGTIAPKAVREAWQLISSLENTPNLRVPKRAKGTGLLEIERGAQTVEFLIRSGPALQRMDALLKSLRSP